MLRFILFVFIFLPSIAFSQSYKGTLVFVSDHGDAFFVFLNGVKQNAGAQSKVTIDGLELPYYDVRIEFLNSSIQKLERKNVTVADSDDRPMQVTYKVRKEKSGKARLSFYAMLPPVSTKSAEVAQMPEVKAEVVQEKTDPSNSKTLLTNVSGATVSIPKKDSAPGRKDSLSISTKEVVVKKAEAAVKAKERKTEPVKPETALKKPANVTTPTLKKDPVPSITKATKEPERPLKKCNDWPMMKEEFQKIKQSVVDMKDETGRLTKAKYVSTTNCLLVSQVSEMAILFTREAAKLDFVKFAYASTIDRPNFDRLKKLFAEPGNIKDFEKFLQTK